MDAPLPNVGEFFVRRRAYRDEQRIAPHRSECHDTVNAIGHRGCNDHTIWSCGDLSKHVAGRDIQPELNGTWRKSRSHDPIQAVQGNETIPAEIDLLVEIGKIVGVYDQGDDTLERAVGIIGAAGHWDRPLLDDPGFDRLADERPTAVFLEVNVDVFAVG